MHTMDIDLVKAPMCPSARLTLMLEGMFGFCVLYMLRVHFSVALVCMTGSSSTDAWLSNSTDLTTPTNSYFYNVTLPGEENSCGSGDSFGSSQDKEGEFDWPKELRGIMLSAFFWGYIVTQIPTGWLTSHFGSKMVIATGMFVANVANVLTPIGARTHPYIVVALRFLVGLGHGVMFPATHALWGKWAPPLERSILIASTYAGTIIGTVISMSFAGFICTIEFDNGWPLIFYIYGVVSFIWWILWLFLAYNTPSVHPRISEKERKYIEESIGPSAYKKKLPIPWKSIAKSPPVWAIVVAHSCNNWGSYTILTCVPQYMKEVLYFDIKANGVLISIPYLAMYVLTLVVGQLGDFLRRRNIFSTTTVRKLFQFLGFGIPTVFIIAVGYVDCEQRMWSIVFLTIAVSATAFGRSAYSINHVDIAPRFAGILFGITNTAATLPGMVSPYIAAAITPNGTAAEWRLVFIICGVIYASGLVVYLIFASGEEQEWAKIAEKEYRQEIDVELVSPENKRPLGSSDISL